jgi:hypothetical protein
MSSSLALPSWASTPSRLLKNGVIFVSPSYPGFARISYPDSGIQEDWFSADPMTVVFSSYFFYYDSQPLTGTIANSPPELISYLGNLLSNAALLKPDASWQPGASFSKVSNRSLSGEIYVDDCFGAPTVNANVTPCASNTTLTAYLQTISSASAGSTSTIQNLPFWVAAGYSAGTPFYQVYFQLNNNVYRGSLKKAGTQSVNMASLNPTYSPTYVDWRWRFNSAAVSSLKAALTF